MSPETQPDVRWLGPRSYVVCSEFRYYDALNGWEIRVPAGFRCDLASIPRVLWTLIDPSDLGELPALLHDWLYYNGGAVCWSRGKPSCFFAYTRAEADDLFLRAMTEAGVSAWKRRAAFGAVRLFGGRAWRG